MAHAIYIGRFQPFHRGHAKIIRETMQTDGIDSLTILVGSSNKPRSVRNPFSYELRYSMIAKWLLSDPSLARMDIRIQPLPDYEYAQHKWYTEVRNHFREDTKYIVGYSKDDSSFYLKEFPELKYIQFNPYTPNSVDPLDATSIRNDWYKGDGVSSRELVCASYEIMVEGPAQELVEEFELFEKEKELFKDYPFPNSLNCCTADPVVICGGHVLLITRKHAPGKNLLALPGGHKDSNETFFQCAIRELKEETGLKVPRKVIEGSLRGSQLFDAPNRSQNICKPSMAYYFEIALDPDGRLPRVKGMDDALDARWVPLSQIKQSEKWTQSNLFDDHYEIISHFTGI